MKRKALNRQHDDSDQSSGQDLECHIKRVKISYTPGELRLQNDLRSMRKLDDVSVEMTETPSFAIISFKTPITGMPNKFLLQVPKFYPHNPPILKGFDSGYYGNSTYFDANGRLLHEDLTTNWTAMNSLHNIIDILRRIRCAVEEEGKSHNRVSTNSFDGVMDIS